MLAAFPIAAFVPTARPDVALIFYRDVLGLTFVEDTPVALLFDLHGIPLRVAKIDAVTPQTGTTLGWRVDDIASTVAMLTARGVTFERYDEMEQDEQGIMRAGGPYIAWFTDPAGNVLSVLQERSE